MDKKYNEAYKFLEKHKLGILSTTSEQNVPAGAAVYYVVDDALNFYFLTHTTSQKYKNSYKNQKAALTVVDDYAQATVQTSGTITEVGTGDEHDEIYRKLAAIHPPGRFAWITPVSKIHEGETRLLKLTPQFLKFSNFSPERSGSPLIEQVI
ncbi:MAG TPA: pyridoxamine 5'-phosphate oxidase family protein [Candidatus Saccharimonadales bacterium]|nr:pyridoxamine 5'-phosphate oxidase family protein [Candidatus Saccharimonadales bacterium]